MRIAFLAFLTVLATGPALAGERADEARELRRSGLVLVKGEAADCARNCARQGYERLLSAAEKGDLFALIEIEQQRMKGAPGAPGLSEIVAIEKTRAEAGDAVAAWRLFRRHEANEIAAPGAEVVRWLTIVAENGAGYPKAAQAAWRLCEIHGRGEGVALDEDAARAWCLRAAEGGHAGAALAGARLQRRG